MLSSVATDIKRLIEEGQCLLSEERRRREYAEWQLKKLQAQLFGSKSEKMDPEQLQLLLEGFEAAAVIDEPGQDAALKRLVIRRAVRAVPFAAQEASALPVDTPVVTAPLPAEYRVIPGAVATAGLLAYLMVAKYCDHLPF